MAREPKRKIPHRQAGNPSTTGEGEGGNSGNGNRQQGALNRNLISSDTPLWRSS